MLLMDKIGGKKLFSFVWLFTIAMVWLGVAYGVGMFYSAEVDVRSVEAEILADRISDCFFEQGMLIDRLLKNDFDIFYECKLNRDVIESSFYFKISVFGESGKAIKDNLGNDIVISEGVLEKACNSKDSEGCVWKERGIIYEQNNKIKKGRLEILAASNQVGERISLIG